MHQLQIRCLIAFWLHWRRFKLEYIVYILYKGVMKHNTLFKHKAINILDSSHNWLLQPFSQDYGLVSHSTHDVCVNFIREWQDRTCSLTSTLNVRFFPWQVHFNAQSFCRKSAEWKVAEEIFVFSYFVLMPRIYNFQYKYGWQLCL